MSRKLIVEFFSNESGQTTTEYILILAVVVTIFMQFRRKLLGVVNKLFVELNDKTNQAICDLDCPT